MILPGCQTSERITYKRFRKYLGQCTFWIRQFSYAGDHYRTPGDTGGLLDVRIRRNGYASSIDQNHNPSTSPPVCPITLARCA